MDRENQLFRLELPSGCAITEPRVRLLRFCQAEYAYYDAIPSLTEDRIEPVDVLATVAVNAFYSANATRIREIHRGMASACDSLLVAIPRDADLLSFDPSLESVRALLHAAVQVPGVLIPVASKGPHRKRRSLVPMLDNVVVAYYLGTSPQRLPAKTQDKARAADAVMDVVRLFRNDLRWVHSRIDTLQQDIEDNGFPLSKVRILEILLWTQVEERGYYR